MCLVNLVFDENTMKWKDRQYFCNDTAVRLSVRHKRCCLYKSAPLTVYDKRRQKDQINSTQQDWFRQVFDIINADDCDEKPAGFSLNFSANSRHTYIYVRYI